METAEISTTYGAFLAYDFFLTSMIGFSATLRC
jgi:hypothetical protein